MLATLYASPNILRKKSGKHLSLIVIGFFKAQHGFNQHFHTQILGCLQVNNMQCKGETERLNYALL